MICGAAPSVAILVNLPLTFDMAAFQPRWSVIPCKTRCVALWVEVLNRLVLIYRSSPSHRWSFLTDGLSVSDCAAVTRGAQCLVQLERAEECVTILGLSSKASEQRRCLHFSAKRQIPPQSVGGEALRSTRMRSRKRRAGPSSAAMRRHFSKWICASSQFCWR